MSQDDDEMMGLEEEAASSSNDDSSSEDETQIEYLAQSRSRRANAGNKMNSLIESAVQEDEFYKTAYEGGFNENDEDAAFESPGHSDVDEVDSDFDRPEEEDEPIGEGEDEERRPRKKQGGYKEPQRGKEILAKNKWAVARMGGPVVAANVVDAKTQAQRLKEAEETEQINTESLKRYEATELDKKKRREKASSTKRVPPPYVAFRSKKDHESLTVPELKTFPKPRVEPTFICAVTGRPAKYKDPLTGMPYATKFAFKVIRDQYNKFLLENRDQPDVADYLSQFVIH